MSRVRVERNQSADPQAAAERLDVALYRALVRQLCQDLIDSRTPPGVEDLTARQVCFARFTLLLMSVAGGMCWSSLPLFLEGLPVGAVRDAAGWKHPDLLPYIEVPRKGVSVPIFHLPVVALSAQALLVAVSSGNGGGWKTGLEDGQPLLPPEQRPSRRWVQKYLAATAVSVPGQVDPLPTVSDYAAVGQTLLMRLYDHDVRFTLLGVYTSPPPERWQEVYPSIPRSQQQLKLPEGVLNDGD